MSQQRMTGVYILMHLTTQTLALSHARALLDEGQQQSRLERALFDFLRSGKGALTGKPWGEATRMWAMAVRHWSAADLDAACESLLRADMSLKDTRSSSDEQLLTSLVLDLCTKKRGIARARGK
jgi:hypothetical protein